MFEGQKYKTIYDLWLQFCDFGKEECKKLQNFRGFASALMMFNVFLKKKGEQIYICSPYTHALFILKLLIDFLSKKF